MDDKTRANYIYVMFLNLVLPYMRDPEDPEEMDRLHDKALAIIMEAFHIDAKNAIYRVRRDLGI